MQLVVSSAWHSGCGDNRGYGDDEESDDEKDSRKAGGGFRSTWLRLASIVSLPVWVRIGVL